MIRIFAVFALLMALAPARAHEVRPAYLEIDQSGAGTYKVTWKQPSRGNLALHLVPHISNGWLESPPSARYAAEGFLIRTWIIKTNEAAHLAGRTVTIEGLENTITDVFVRVRLVHGQALDKIVRPGSPSFRISLQNGNAMPVYSFILLGIEHILSGLDHLAFVLGLLLLVSDRWMLLKTVTSFTVAHSLTLAAATLGTISLYQPLLDALIGLSILFLAPEIIRARKGGTSLTIRYPWIVAFAFGLVHGLGFASGLTSLGLDRGSLLGALVSFNVGVEIGQLAFIGTAISLYVAFGLTKVTWPRGVALAPAYVIGISGAMWTFQYSAAALTGY